MNSFNVEWDIICRICLQEGVMMPIFDENCEESLLSTKISFCSSIVVKKDANMPEHICNKCIDDLEVAYTFRTNCESSEAILRSYAVETVDNHAAGDDSEPFLNDAIQLDSKTNAGQIYKFHPPSGLDVRRIRKNVKIEQEDVDDDSKDIFVPFDEMTNNTEVEHIQATGDLNESEYLDDGLIERLDVESQPEEEEEDCEAMVSAEPILPIPVMLTSAATMKYLEDISPSPSQLPCQPNDSSADEVSEVLHIKPVRTNKARLANQPQAQLPGVNVQQTIVKCEDGTQLIRLKRVFDPKPMKVCEICGNQYKYQHALDSHMRRHRNEKPFECDICGKGFVINFELSRHKRTHTGQKPYACKFCDRKFSDFGSRIKHERTHTGERPYRCATCGKTFAYSHVLSSHNLTHTGEKRYHCEVCGKKFSKSHHLKAHMNTHSRHKTVKFENVTPDRNYRDMMALIAPAPKVEIMENLIVSDGTDITGVAGADTDDGLVEEIDASEFHYDLTADDECQFDVVISGHHPTSGKSIYRV